MEDSQLVGFTLLPISLIGVVCNWSIVYIIPRLRSMRHSFGYLTTQQAFFDACHSSLFLFYVTPMIIFDFKFLKTYSYHCGFGLMLTYDMSLMIHFLISCNRCVAVYKPISYNRIFSVQSSKLFIFFCATFTLTVGIVIFKILNCEVFYIDEYWLFFYNPTPTCIQYSWYGEFGRNLGFAIVDVLIDIATILKVHTTSKRLSSHGRLPELTSGRNRKQEMNFLKQTCGQGFYIFLALTTYFILSQYVQNHWLRFLMTTFAWCAAHALDGVFTIYFNSEVRNYLTQDNNEYARKASTLSGKYLPSMTSISKF